MKKEFILVGKISGAHGLKGALNIYSFAEDPHAFARGTFVYVKDRKRDEYELFEIVSSNIKKASVILVRFKEIDGRNKAEELRGRELYIPKESLPENDDDSWYWHDLIGMEVFEEDGSRLGLVDNLMRTGSSDILEVTGSNKEEILIPFLKDIIVSVSVNDKKIIVNLPEGLID